MRTTVPYAGGELEAMLDGEIWYVRLGELEESSPYLDYALSQLLDVEAASVHQLAARLVERFLTLVGEASPVANHPSRG
jgi:hypothetical protein